MGSNFGPASERSNFSTVPDTPSLPARRHWIVGGLGLSLAALMEPALAAGRRSGEAATRIGFESIPVSTADDISIPPGYRAQVLYAWGDSIGHPLGSPAFSTGNTSLEQTLQAGMHHDGMHFFPFAEGNRGLLAVNHEYTDDGLLHTGGMAPWTPEKVRKSQAAQGIAVVEIARTPGNGDWRVVRPSRYARRITAYTPMRLTGPAAGDAQLKTTFDPHGRLVLGTLNNCGHGYTPWGTYLSCEENWNAYFHGRTDAPAEETRYGVRPNGFGYRWHEHDERFDVARHPNEPNRFGWVVELDPFDPDSTPQKRTALGRTKHEGALVTVTRDRRAVIYMGDDERFEYIYKFVSRDAIQPGGYARNRDLLDHGTLYVARLDDSGEGVWLALVHGENGLTRENGFASQADVLIRTRQAADRAGATPMDRPEWIALHPASGEVRRFLVGPRGCEITGVVMSPDLRSMFVNIQHPGEPANERSDPARPTAISAWPRHTPCDRPRSATIVITRADGGIVGA